LGDVGYGIAAIDPAVGEGWILWSEQSVFSRFNPVPIGGNAEHLVAVKNVGGQWFYDNNGGLFEFEPDNSDCLVASVNFATDTVTLLEGVKAVVEGIDSGYESGDFTVVANQWANVSNGGEFGVSGTSLVQAGGAGTTVPNASIPTIPQIDDYQLVFGDEFTGTELDTNLWDTSLLWGPYHVINNEEQMYVDTLGMHSSFSHTPFTFTGETLKITASKVNASLQPPVRPAANSPLWQPNSYS